MRSRSCKQIWGTLRLEISVAFEIFGQEVARWRYWSLPGGNENELRDEMLAASLVILPFFISICARFRRNYWPKDYHSISCPHSNGKNHHQSSCRVWTCPNYVIVDDSRWYCMIILIQTCVIVEIIINYHDRFNGSLHTGALQLTKRFFLLPNRYIINSKSWEINMTLKWWKNVTLLEWQWLERLWGQICWVRTVITAVYIGSINIHEFGWAFFCEKSLVDLIGALWSLAGGWFLCFVCLFVVIGSLTEVNSK